MPDHQRLRVIFRCGRVEQDMGVLPDSYTGPRSLDPYISRLIAHGVPRGRLLLVNESTGDVVAVRDVSKPFRRFNRQ